MKQLLPPTRATVLRNARLLADDWMAAGPLARYFIVSQFASGALLGLCSAAGIAALIAGLHRPYLGLLAAAALCFVHTVATWNVLKARFRIRYEVW